MRTLGIVVTLLVAACAPKSGNAPSKMSATPGSTALPPPPVATKQGPTCESAVANSISLTIAATPEDQRESARAGLDASKPKMIAACHEDQWSAQLLDCLDTARTDAATGKCADLLTQAQKDAFQNRIDGP